MTETTNEIRHNHQFWINELEYCRGVLKNLTHIGKHCMAMISFNYDPQSFRNYIIMQAASAQKFGHEDIANDLRILEKEIPE